MTVNERADLLIAQLDEMASKLPNYDSVSTRLEFVTVGKMLRGVKIPLAKSRTIKIPQQFRVPQNEYWGRPAADPTDFPPGDFAPLGQVAISADGPALYSKADDGWKEVT